MESFVYETDGSCSRRIELDMEDGIILRIKIEGGCDGNIQGLMKLVTGMEAGEIIRRLKGIRCGVKETSCPDQLARALEKYLCGKDAGCRMEEGKE